MQKIAQVTAIFWIMKICATTLGETAGDLLSQTLNVGYAISSMILFSIFLISLMFQLFSKKYHPFLYWTVILTTSTAGTTMSDYMDRSLGLGYATGSFILVCILLAIFSFWYFSERSLNVNNITTRKVEVIYWIAILFSNTLGTALGDFLADSSGLGFVGGAVLIGSLLGLILLLTYSTNVSRVFLFWLAFVLTRPFGATFGDLLTKSHAKGGLDLGTMGSSLVLFIILITLIIYITPDASKMKQSPELNAS
ncbi:hypothetical protein FQU75_03280 [Paenibacillus polymyxa]|nr:hypothetical protein FQU75_03280 [Paenibacillus polymyxa]